MTPKQWYTANRDNRERLEQVCKGAGTSVANLQQIAIANGSVGKGLAKRLSEASNGEMSILEILYPEDFEKAEENAA